MLAHPFWFCFASALIAALVPFISRADADFAGAVQRFLQFPFWFVLVTFLVFSICRSVAANRHFRLARTVYLHSSQSSDSRPQLTSLPPVRPGPALYPAPITPVERDITTATPRLGHGWSEV